jgi:PKD repeat protein
MSRAYIERNKVGFVKTRHQKAGDDPSKPFSGFFMAGSSDWGLDGVQCTMCHSTAKPARDDLIQIVPAGVVGPPAAGAPKSATGHNQTEYGAHLLDVCYTCHGSPANPITTNPASVIPVSAGDFALTDNPPPSNVLTSPAPVTGVGGLAPIVNQFLNSPHALYTGTSTKTDIGNKNNYGSPFVGYVCRSTNAIGQGSILTTMFRNGVALRIPNLDRTTNPACTNPGNGSPTSGAGGFWVKEGESSAGVPTDTAQGTCMTCHDHHWALADTDPEAEPFRRECTTCHVNSGPSATAAPQIDLATINHLKTAGTPLENWLTKPAEACEICHMPKSGGSDSSRMHLWRINTDPNYQTMGATEANLAPAPGYVDAAWVDLDRACGQCHGGNGGTPKPGAPHFTTAQLAEVAEGMHESAGVSYPVTFGIAISALKVTVTPSVECGGPCPAFTYDWDWGDGSAHGTGNPDSHTYASGGQKSITLTVFSGGKKVGSTTRTVTLTTSAPPPVASATCEWTPETWTMKVTDSSTGGTPPLQIVVRWGDSSGPTITTQNGVVSHTYLTPNGAPYTVTETAIDANLRKSVTECAPVSPVRFQITGRVLREDTGTGISNATVRLRKGGTIVKHVTTAADGTFSLNGVRAGDYLLKVVKTGFTFPPPSPVTVGPDSSGNVITGTKL